MALTTITKEMVSVNAIQGTLIADNAITAVHIATNAVSGTLIADNAITATHIAQNVITVTQLADDCVESDKIADGVITTNHLNKAMISSQTEVAVATGDFVLLGDTSDSNNLKKAPISSILAGTLTTAAQTNITSLGTLSSLGVGAITSTAASTITTADNLAQLTLVSTDTDSGIGPVLDLKRNPNEAGADNDYLGQVHFTGHNDAGTPEDIVYSKLTSQILDASDGTEDANMVAYVMKGGSRADMFRLGPTEAVFNESSNDIDFRVESNDNSSMLFVDAGNNKIGVGTSSPTGMLTMVDNDDGVNNEFIRLVNDPGGSTAVGTGAKISFAPHHSGTEVASISAIAETTGAGTGIVFTTHSGASLTEKVRISKDGNLGAGTDAPQTEIHLSGANTSAGALGSVVGAGNVPSLTIQNSNATDNNLAGIFFRDNADMRSAIHSVFVSHAGGDQKSQLRFSTSSSGNMREKMTLTEDGKLGVGTTNPSAYIQVEHDISCYHGANEWVTIRGLSGGQYIEYGSGAALSFVAVDTFPHSGASTKASIRTSGALEVGAGFTSGQGGSHGLNTGVKMSSFSHVIDSTDVSNGYVDITTNIARAAYLGISPSIYDANANVAKMGYRSDGGFITYTDGYNNLVRVGLGGDVANTDTLKCVVFYQ